MEYNQEDEEFKLLEQRLQKQQSMEENPVYRANIAAAEYIQSQSAELLAITNLRQAFIYGYRTAWRDKDTSKEKK